MISHIFVIIDLFVSWDLGWYIMSILLEHGQLFVNFLANTLTSFQKIIVNIYPNMLLLSFYSFKPNNIPILSRFQFTWSRWFFSNTFKYRIIGKSLAKSCYYWSWRFERFITWNIFSLKLSKSILWLCFFIFFNLRFLLRSKRLFVSFIFIIR